MELSDFIEIGIFILALLMFTWKVNKDNSKKVSYQSLDRAKKDIEDKFRTVEVCKILHSGVKEILMEVQKDVKKLLSQNGLK